MANKTKGFVVVSGVRPSGVPYWIVRGSIGGKQVRKEFADRVAAKAYQEQRNSEVFGAPRVAQAPVLTRLNADQVREAEVVIAQLEREFSGMSLSEVLDYYRAAAPSLPMQDVRLFASALDRVRMKFPQATLADACDFFVGAFRPDLSGITLGAALESYAQDVERRRETQALGWWQARSIRINLEKFECHFAPTTKLGSITTSQLHDFLLSTSRGKDGSQNYSNKTWANRRGYLTRFFNHCIEEGWLETNPAEQVRKYSKRDYHKPTPTVLSIQRVQDLMADAEVFAQGRLVPYLVLTLYCGLRPSWRESEITRFRADQIDLHRAELRMPASTTKTRKPRVIKLQPNVIRWLEQYPIAQYPVMARNFRKLIIAFRKKHKLEHDVLRHTYASMLVGKTRSVGEAALQAGNSENILWSNYLNLAGC